MGRANAIGMKRVVTSRMSPAVGVTVVMLAGRYFGHQYHNNICVPHVLRSYPHESSDKNILLVGMMSYQTCSMATFTSNIDTPDLGRKSTGKLNCDSQGIEVHAHMVKSGIEQNIFYATKLVIMYAKHGNLANARLIFDKMHKPDVFSWTAMITGYSRHGCYEETLALFYKMKASGIQPDPFIIPSVLKACAGLGGLQKGEGIHACIIRGGFESNVFAASALVDMYAKCGRIKYACQVFDKMPQRSVVAWNATIAGYAQNGHADDALKLFTQMQQEGMKPSWVTFIIILPACANLGLLQQGREIHNYVIRTHTDTNVFVGSALIDMYVKCGSIHDARRVFEKLSQRNVVTWNTMIAGYAQSGQVEAAWELLCQMQLQDVKPDRITWNAIISGYAQNGYGDEAWKVFHKMQLSGIKPDVISWNTIIAGCAQNKHWDAALKYFRQLQISGPKPNSVTIASVLPACANLAALQQGKEIHDYIIRIGFDSDVYVGSALLDMYAKCGSIENARNLFIKMSQTSVVLWNAMIAGYAMHGHSEQALKLFNQMQHERMKPDHITFIGVLSACSHSGLVREGWQYFECMSKYYHIKPRVEHYACMVDLLGRAGHLDEAHNLITNMTVEPDVCVWGALLGACRIHCNIELGKWAAERLFAIEPENIGSYVLMSNIHAAAGRWDDVTKLRKMMQDRGLRKSPGCSWIEIKNRVHVFLVGDTSHPQTEKIYAMLDCLAQHMKVAGYVPDTNFLLHDVE
eukprot:Gb_10776 [translate_table: standard]